MKNILTIFCFLLSLTSLTSQVSLLKDINIDSADSGIKALFKADGYAYFKYKNASGWYNILKTNGTTQKKVLPYDVQAITEAEYGEGLVYFTDETHLWVTDGTSEGTREILFYGYPATEIFNLTYSAGTLWFAGNSGGDRELYWCDSYYAQEIEINPWGSSYPYYLTDFNGALYFQANDGVNGYELFKAEHLSPYFYTSALVKDILPGGGSGSPSSLYAWNGNLYFTADDGVNGAELWKSDGTTAGTVLVSDIWPGWYGSWPTGFAGLGDDMVLFTAYNDISGYELWRTNGTAAGTELVMDILTGPESSYPSRLTFVDGTVYFSAYTPETGSELWKTNGTAAGTALVKDIEPGPSNSSPLNFTAGTSRLYFSANSAATGRELYSTTGTASSTKLMADIAPATLDGISKSHNGLTLGNTLVFPAQNGAIGMELWKSTGTAAGTKLLQDCLNSDSNPLGFTKSGDYLFFSAEIDSIGTELWKTDGTTAGTVLVKDIRELGSSDPAHFTDLNGLLIFTAISAGTGTEIWASDGTAAGTFQIKDIGDGWGGSKPHNLKKIGNAVYFSARNTSMGFELWKTDGTEAGTMLVKEINAGPEDSDPSELYDIGGGISLFMATTAGQGRELWKTDGTAEGTVLVKDIESGPGSGIGYDYSDGAVLAGIFYFRASDDAQGNELWRSDGTEAGTYIVKDINPGAPHSAPFSFATMGNSVYFAAFSPSKGIEVWKTDGTAAGTVLLKDISVGSSSSIYENLESFQNVFSVVNGNLYFSANSLSSGQELWRSDGTAAGTIQLKDIIPGSQGSYPYALGASSTLFLFGAYHPTFGAELWKSSGTAGGTVMVQDIYSGEEGSIPSNGAVLGNKFIFGALSNFNGVEVLAYTLPAGTYSAIASNDRTEEEAQQAPVSAQSQIFKVYPNPANEVAYLEFFEKPAGEIQVNILDISGKMVAQHTATDTDNVEINVADLPAGVYLIQASNAKWQESRKLVVQR